MPTPPVTPSIELKPIEPSVGFVRPSATPLQRGKTTSNPHRFSSSYSMAPALQTQSIDSALGFSRNNRPCFQAGTFAEPAESGNMRARPTSVTSATSNAQYSVGGSRLSPSSLRRMSAQHVMPHFMPSPTLQIVPERLDYFQSGSRETTSFRAAINLALVVGGRVIITFGTGGLQAGFAPNRAIGPGVPTTICGDVAPPVDHPGEPVLHYIGLGILATVIGVTMAATGIFLFARDTRKLGPRRAYLMGGISGIGLLNVTLAAIVYVYGQAGRSLSARYASIFPNVLGNFCLFYAITNSFPASEIVHGNVPLLSREQTRLCAFGIGGGAMVAWTTVAAGSQNAPLWAREICKAAGITGLHLGASLGRTDAIRWQAENRFLEDVRFPSFALPAGRRQSSIAPDELPNRIDASNNV